MLAEVRSIVEDFFSTHVSGVRIRPPVSISYPALQTVQRHDDSTAFDSAETQHEGEFCSSQASAGLVVVQGQGLDQRVFPVTRAPRFIRPAFSAVVRRVAKIVRCLSGGASRRDWVHFSTWQDDCREWFSPGSRWSQARDVGRVIFDSSAQRNSGGRTGGTCRRAAVVRVGGRRVGRRLLTAKSGRLWRVGSLKPNSEQTEVHCQRRRE